MLTCESSNYRFKFNYYLSKLSINTTEIKGNSTYEVPLDDSYAVSIVIIIIKLLNLF